MSEYQCGQWHLAGAWWWNEDLGGSYTTEEREVRDACDRRRRQLGKEVLTDVEVLAVLKSLGYRRRRGKGRGQRGRVPERAAVSG